MRKRLLIIALAVTVGATYGLVKTSAALAYGQCGGTVYTGSQLYHAWSKMGVTSQAAGVMRSAGFHRMDNSLSIWMRQRVVRANLARSASPIDYGCNPGNLFSVGHRLLPKGTPLMVVLPAKYSKGEVRESPHKGFHRIVVRVRAAGKSNCSNPERGPVFVYIYVRVVHKTHHKVKKPKTVSCSAGYVLQNGSCVSQTQIAENNCEQAAKDYPGSTVSFNSNTLECTIVQVQSNCSTTIVVNGSGNVVNVTTSGNCNNSPPPPPPPPPAPTYQCTGLSLSLSGLSATAVISTSVSGGASFKSATINWGDSNSTTGGLNQSHTYASSGTYGVKAVVTFNLPNSTTATANCSGSVTITPTVTGSCTGFEEISGDGSMLITCQASDTNGAPIYLSASSNDSNSYVSGINCYSNGGTQSCPSGGTFQFRVNGVNSGSTVLMSSVTVTFTASGANPYSPPPYVFKVDPSSGGF